MEYFVTIWLCLMALYVLIHGIAWTAVLLEFLFNLGIHDWASKKQAQKPRFPR